MEPGNRNTVEWFGYYKSWVNERYYEILYQRDGSDTNKRLAAEWADLREKWFDIWTSRQSATKEQERELYLQADAIECREPPVVYDVIQRAQNEVDSEVVKQNYR